MDAMYGGVMNGTIKRMSSQRRRASWVRASRKAVGAAMTVEQSTTHTPRSRELQTVSAFSGLTAVLHA